MKIIHSEIRAKGKPENTPLSLHLYQVAETAKKFAPHFKLKSEVAYLGGLFHDIGKTHPVFQERLSKMTSKQNNPFRHEIASIFFLSLVDEKIQADIIEMIIAHHKSIKDDPRELGILDLEYRFDDVFGLHIGTWEEWSNIAMEILLSLGIKKKKITKDDEIGRASCRERV